MTLAAAVLGQAGALAQSAPARVSPVPCGACVAIAVTPSQALTIASSGDSLTSLTVLIDTRAATASDSAAALAALGERGARTGAIVPLTSNTQPIAPLTWGIVVFDITSEGALDPKLAFRVKTAATAIRAVGGSRVGLLALASQTPQVSALGVSPYVDFAIVDAAPTRAENEKTTAMLTGVERWTRVPNGVEFDAARVLAAASAEYAATALMTLPPGREELAPVLARLAAAVPSGLAPLPEVRVECDVACESEAFLDAASLEAVIMIRPRGRVSRVRVLPRAGRLTAIIPSLAGLVPALGVAHAWEIGRDDNELTFPAAVGQPFVLRAAGWAARTEETFATGVEVNASRALTVEEIVARHQAARARQDRLVRSLISWGTTVLTFDAPSFSAPVTVTADTTIYSNPSGTEVEQRNIRVNGLALTSPGDQTPRLPIVEAERVATPPLTIALNEAYTYRLVGQQVVRSRQCYLVAFEPRTKDMTLFSGRAWIDADTFGVVRMEATQTALPGPVVASRQADDFAPFREEGATVWLGSRSEINQTYETANYSTPIRRVVALGRHQVNAEDFAARLDAAHASDAVMMKDTPEGYRYLRRERKGGAGACTRRTVVEGRAQRVLTVAGGVTIDPNITQPLVFAGLSYLDTDLFGKGAQIDGFFGGLYGRLAWASPPLGRSSWRVSGDAFGLAVSYNDRAFRNGVEQYRENVLQRPIHASAGLVGPLAAGLRLRAAYEMDYTAYERSSSTAPDFVVPPSTAVHGIRLTVERQRGPWTISGWWNGALRQEWRSWGLETSVQPPIRGFQRFGVRAVRSLVWSPRAVGRVEVSWMDGARLDRFSRYAFGTFDNPLRGYPTASIRFDRGLVLRSAASWTAAAHLRLDGFADFAIVRDPGLSASARGFPGIGAGVEAPLPFSLLTAIEWGYGFGGRKTSGRTGTQVVRVSVYKVF